MNDREKVIKDAEKELEFLAPDEKNKLNIGIMMKLGWIYDALALLKEQEAVEPRRINGKHNHFIKCGNCNYDLLTGYLFCPRCGKAVKWE